MTLHFGKLRRTLAWGLKGWFLLVHEPEPMVCEMKWSSIAYVREEYLKLCSQTFVSSNHVSAFEWKLRSSRQAGRHHFQIEDGLKSISVKHMRQLPGPTANIYFWVINKKLYRSKNVAFSHGSESATIYCFYPFLFVISAEFIIRFFGLAIMEEKWYQIRL